VPPKSYLIDSNVLMTAANSYYSFDTVPSFWDWLADVCDNGPVATVTEVRDEVEYPIALVDWVDERDEDTFFIDVSDPSIQDNYTELANWVVAQSYGAEYIGKFLSGADLWLIAAAKKLGASVVTEEKAAGVGSRKVQIPDVCLAFNLRCVNTFSLLRELNATI